jgi:hypothetical protein
MIILLQPAYKFVELFFLSSVKFVFTPLLSKYIGFNFLETFIITAIFGIFWVTVFYYLSSALILIYHYILTGKFFGFKGKPKRVFTKRNRRIVRFKSTFGYLGVIAFTPILLSLPLGSFLARRYYSHKKLILPLIFVSIGIWAFILTCIMNFFY